MNLEIGTVFRWNNFPLPKYGNEQKARWFICVGFTGIFAQVAQVYLYTTTTQLECFKSTGTRCNHSNFIFKKSEHPIFDEDCAIDFDEKPYTVEHQRLKILEGDIKIKGKLREEPMRMIYKRLLSAHKLSKMEMLDVHTSYNNVGITQLKKPK